MLFMLTGWNCSICSFIDFKEGDVGKASQLFRGWRGGRGPLQVGEVLLTKLNPGWCQVVPSYTVELCTLAQMIYKEIVDNT